RRPRPEDAYRAGTVRLGRPDPLHRHHLGSTPPGVADVVGHDRPHHLAWRVDLGDGGEGTDHEPWSRAAISASPSRDRASDAMRSSPTGNGAAMTSVTPSSRQRSSRAVIWSSDPTS